MFWEETYFPFSFSLQFQRDQNQTVKFPILNIQKLWKTSEN